MSQEYLQDRKSCLSNVLCRHQEPWPQQPFVPSPISKPLLESFPPIPFHHFKSTPLILDCSKKAKRKIGLPWSYHELALKDKYFA